MNLKNLKPFMTYQFICAIAFTAWCTLSFDNFAYGLLGLPVILSSIIFNVKKLENNFRAKIVFSIFDAIYGVTVIFLLITEKFPK
jgi:hypothetical protein